MRDRLFDATLALNRVPLTRWQLRRVFWRHPWMTVGIMAAIHWQATTTMVEEMSVLLTPEKTRLARRPRPPDR